MIPTDFSAEALDAFIDEADGFDPDVLTSAAETALGVSWNDLDPLFRRWLDEHPPGDQVDDLRLTIQLQDARRAYQAAYQPDPRSWFGTAADGVAITPAAELMREARTPPHVAAELLIAAAQRSLTADEYASTDRIVHAIEDVVESGTFTTPTAIDHLQLATLVAEKGLELVSIEIDGDRAVGLAVATAPDLTDVVAVRTADGWAWQNPGG